MSLGFLIVWHKCFLKINGFTLKCLSKENDKLSVKFKVGNNTIYTMTERISFTFRRVSNIIIFVVMFAVSNVIACLY